MDLWYKFRIFSRSWSPSIPTFGLWRVFSIAKTYRLSFGFWFRLSTDEVKELLTKRHGEWDGYQPLGSRMIRVVELESGEKDDPLRGRFHYMTLEQWAVSPGEAVSYVWGNPATTSGAYGIHIEGKQITIYPSLFGCLKELRSQSVSRLLWCDSICINQSSLEEKAAQIRLMEQIFGSASRVIVWLGPLTIPALTGMEILRYLATETRPSHNPPWCDVSPDIAAEGLSEIMTRGWFTRLWVVQEAALAQELDIKCGPVSISWNTRDVKRLTTFVRMIKYAEISPSWEQCGLTQVDMQPLLELLGLQLRQRTEGFHDTDPPKSRDMLDMMHDLRHKQATDRRDKIFALLGLVPNNEVMARSLPNYNQSVDETYARFLDMLEF